jgi:IMP dehydrogenase
MGKMVIIDEPRNLETPFSLKVGTDDAFYQGAEDFFTGALPDGLTFDDVTLATNYSEVLPREAELETALSESLDLHIPIISADMDTVTESGMAIAMALSGGLGLIHYNMSEDRQIREVTRVKHNVHGLIQDPITVRPEQTIGDILDLITSSRAEFRTFPVVDTDNVLLGLLRGNVLKSRYREKLVRDAMNPRNEVYTLNEKDISGDPIGAADRFFYAHMGIHKLLVVDDRDRLCGLFTLSDIESITEESGSVLKPARDSKFRLICGAAVHAPRSSTGELDQDRIVNHTGKLVDAGVDAVAVSTAHGHTSGVGAVVRMIRHVFPDLTIIAGNITSAEGVEFLSEAGADAIKVGQGPGSICTTRVVAGVGVPQLTALYLASRAATASGVKILADGGLAKSGDIVKALTLADAVICGGLLAGCRESPGKIVEINGQSYKEYRGMGSAEAMKAGSASRYGHDLREPPHKLATEGVDALKEVSGALDVTLRQLAGGLQAGMGYLGAYCLDELKKRARYIRITSAGHRESEPHDIIQVKTARESS